jgi:outer membrane protein insertion porin family
MVTRLLQEDEYLLVKQNIKSTQKASKKALVQYCQQQPNSRWLGVPFLLWVYEVGQRRFDEAAIQQRTAQIETKYKTKIAAAANEEHALQRLHQRLHKKRKKQEKYLTEGNLLMRYGEPPVIYNPQQKAITEQRFLAYLHAKGYFNAQVHGTVELWHQKAIITYQITENQPHLLGELRLNTSDKAIEKLLHDHQRQSLLKQGDHYDQDVLCQERERIYELLSNHGYFGFDRQYIRFDIDTTAADNTVVVETVIDMPADGRVHPVFRIDKVDWDVDADQAKEGTKVQATHYDGVTFRHVTRRFNPSILASKLTLRPLQLYKKQDLIDIQRRLARLDMFKYINMTYDVVDVSKLVPRIHTTPADRFQLANELGLQVSRSHWLPKPFYGLSLKGRNLCNRLETWELATHVGVEGVATTKKDFASSQAYGVGLTLSCSLPQFLLPCKTRTHNYLERLDPMTKLSLGYEFTRHPDYTQDTLTSFIRYDWKGQARGAYEFTPFRIELTNARRISDEFKSNLEALQLKPFEPFWLTLLSFRSMFREQPRSDADLSYMLLDLFCESGGTLQNFIDLRKIMPQLTYYQYIKVDVSYSQHIPICSGTVFAYRINTGIGYAYGREKVLPYSRYYVLGSSNGMRAWHPHSLGPGSYNPQQKAHAKQSMEQLGELLLQGSVELRQKLVGFVEGALFVDAGNIWTLRDAVRKGGKFSFQNFHKEIAVGTGVGLRFNFKLLVLRLDAGVKLYDPARPLGSRFIGDQLFSNKPVVSIGIDYPF